METPKKLKIGNRVKFNYFDNELEKEVSGIGILKEIDTCTNNYYIQTTRKLHWVAIVDGADNVRAYTNPLDK